MHIGMCKMRVQLLFFTISILLVFIGLDGVHPASNNASSKLRWKEHVKNNKKASKCE